MFFFVFSFFCQAEDGIRELVRSRGLGDVYKRQVIGSVMQKSLSEAEIKKSDIDLISFSMGPGLGPCLRIVASAARSLSINLNIPVSYTPLTLPTISSV